jgi:hypothetical protein
MPSLSQILRSQFAPPPDRRRLDRIQVGLLGRGEPARWSCRRQEAGVGIFECIDLLDVDLGRVRAFAFCEGPGSILGIRTSAMALRMWGVLEPRPHVRLPEPGGRGAGPGEDGPCRHCRRPARTLAPVCPRRLPGARPGRGAGGRIVTPRGLPALGSVSAGHGHHALRPFTPHRASPGRRGGPLPRDGLP